MNLIADNIGALLIIHHSHQTVGAIVAINIKLTAEVYSRQLVKNYVGVWLMIWHVRLFKPLWIPIHNDAK